MLILALDTCDSRGSVALSRHQDLLQTVVHETSEDYSSWLLPAVNRLLHAESVQLPDIDVYAVAAGPGSFTGLRVGLTTAKAWAELYNRPIAPVSRLHAIVLQSTGSAPYVAAFFDARRNQLFATLYRRQDRSLHPVSDEAVIAPENFVAHAIATAGSSPIDWVSLDPQCLTNVPLCLAQLQSRHESVQQASVILAPLVGQIAHSLALENRLTDSLSLDANYIRRSDAEVFWKGASHRP